MNNLWIRSLLALVVAALSVQCAAKKSKSSAAVITVSPERPTVIDVDIEDPETKASWFEFDVTIDNQTEYPFEIIGLKAEVTSMDESGFFVTKTNVWVPSESNFTLDSLVCNYSTFGVFAVNEKKKLQIYDQFNQNCPEGNIRFVSDGNSSGPDNRHFRYKVKLTPIGYFVDSTGEAEDRFEKFKVFYTQ